jgi:hypothetical protein
VEGINFLSHVTKPANSPASWLDSFHSPLLAALYLNKLRYQMKKILLSLSVFSLIACSPAAINVKPDEINQYWIAKNELSSVLTTKSLGCGVFSPEKPNNEDSPKPSALVNYTITSYGVVSKVSASDYRNGLTKKDLEPWINLMNLAALTFYDSALPSAQSIVVSEVFYLHESKKHCK